MTGFKPRTTGIRSNHSTNLATTTEPFIVICFLLLQKPKGRKEESVKLTLGSFFLLRSKEKEAAERLMNNY